MVESDILPRTTLYIYIYIYTHKTTLNFCIYIRYFISSTAFKHMKPPSTNHTSN